MPTPCWTRSLVATSFNAIEAVKQRIAFLQANRQLRQKTETLSTVPSSGAWWPMTRRLASHVTRPRPVNLIQNLKLTSFTASSISCAHINWAKTLQKTKELRNCSRLKTRTHTRRALKSSRWSRLGYWTWSSTTKCAHWSTCKTWLSSSQSNTEKRCKSTSCWQTKTQLKSSKSLKRRSEAWQRLRSHTAMRATKKRVKRLSSRHNLCSSMSWI